MSEHPATTLRVAACQLRADHDPTENLRRAGELVARAAADGARLVVLPEATMACFGTDLAGVAEPLDGPFAEGVRELACRRGLTVVAGMFTPADDGRVHNTLIAAGPEGETRYDKIHLFDAFGTRESQTVAPGSALVTHDVEGVTVGLATCYDVRFADQFTALARAGAELVVLPASWADGPGKAEQWDLLVRARAADAQAWLLAADQAWVAEAGRAARGIGRSALLDPTGSVRARLGAEVGVLVGDVDTETVAQTRARVPIL